MVAIVMGPLIRVALASVLLAGALSSAAGAETICVNVSSAECASPQESQLGPALSRAATHPGIDTIDIGPGEYATVGVSGFSYSSPDPVRLLGAGIGRTVLRSGVEAPQHVLSLSVPAGQATAETRVSGLSVFAGQLTSGSSAALIAGQVDDSEFTGLSTENATTFALSATEGSTLSHVQAAAFGPAAVGIGADGPVRITDSVVRGTIGIMLAPGGEATGAIVQRTRLLTSGEGLDVCNTAALAEDVAIQITGGVGVDVEGTTRCGAGSSLFTGRNLTITGSGGQQGGVGLEAGANTTNPSATLTDSILWELTNAIRTQTLAGKTTSLHLARLAEDPSTLQFNGAGTLILADDKGNVGDPKLVDPARGDLHLSPDSPAIDAALAGPVLPGESTTDLEGAPRVVDGNGDGIAQRDIGAVESPSLVPAIAAKSPLSDLTAPRLRGVRLRRGRHPHLELFASEAGRVRVTLRGLPRGCRQVSRRCRVHTLATQTDPVRRGSNNIGLAGLMARSLKRATSLQLTATDFAGNRSALTLRA